MSLAVKTVGKPDAGNPHVRFDERGRETGPLAKASTLPRPSSTLQRAFLFLSANDGLNRAHTTWLEWELVQRALSAKRCRLENRAEPSEPNLIESEKADTRAFLNEMLRFMPIMGLSIFDRPKSAPIAALAAAGLAPETKDIKDTVIVPAQREGFESAFLGANAWWAIWIAEKHRANLKWIAAYQVAPVASITHIAEIGHIEPYGDAGKFKCSRGCRSPWTRPFPTATPLRALCRGRATPCGRRWSRRSASVI